MGIFFSFSFSFSQEKWSVKVFEVWTFWIHFLSMTISYPSWFSDKVDSKEKVMLLSHFLVYPFCHLISTKTHGLMLLIVSLSLIFAHENIYLRGFSNKLPFENAKLGIYKYKIKLKGDENYPLNVLSNQCLQRLLTGA